jgi:hypothetical protein
MDPLKRQLREIKRAVKRAGNKARRQRLKRDVAENPETAHLTEFDFGRDSSAGFNGMDQDSTRRRTAAGESPTP